ncbi:hypothetical protein Mnod_4852 [Methylobacterium nodulans ORS 2060]|uniref:Uncharacterized protein n=1 Tax=Methylobacterium nodulans (strain LMG 21967 / CNCM I-2342 / ORS 2060) TaxID=460265 RepID=B8IG04_METNO|nr:hypothetical protein Mnod_4852 [Methylobacterium nodulans ORS 2060]
MFVRRPFPGRPDQLNDHRVKPRTTIAARTKAAAAVHRLASLAGGTGLSFAGTGSLCGQRRHFHTADGADAICAGDTAAE